MGGVCDSVSQPLVILFAALNQADVSKVLSGPLSGYSVEMLRNMKEFLGVTFRLEMVHGQNGKEGERKGRDKVMLTCIGVGYQNLNKQTL